MVHKRRRWKDGRRQDRNPGSSERCREKYGGEQNCNAKERCWEDTRAQRWCRLLAFTESTLAETLLNSTISWTSEAINRFTFPNSMMSVSGPGFNRGGKQNNLNYSEALSLSGHPFNGIITSLFIRAWPGRYITSLRSSPAFCDKRPLLGMWRRRGEAEA